MDKILKDGKNPKTVICPCCRSNNLKCLKEEDGKWRHRVITFECNNCECMFEHYVYKKIEAEKDIGFLIMIDAMRDLVDDGIITLFQYNKIVQNYHKYCKEKKYECVSERDL